MIQTQTCLKVADNSGANKLMCIRVLGSNRRYGHVGDVIIGVVKDATPNLTVKRSDVVRAVIVRTKQSVRRKDGSRLRFDDNASVIVNASTKPLHPLFKSIMGAFIFLISENMNDDGGGMIFLTFSETIIINPESIILFCN